jgi:transcriptional regulator with XRE-family HTH domain
MIAFGDRLKQLRESAGLNVHDLADKAGLPANSIYGWERGLITPSVGSAAKLATALGGGLELFNRCSFPPDNRGRYRRVAVPRG